MNFLLVTKSVFDLFIAYVWGKLNSSSETIYLVGSNYGGRPDPSALALVEHLCTRDCVVVTVGDWGMNGRVRVVSRGTVRAAYYLFSSKASFYTHSLSDVIPHGHKLAFLKRLFSFPALVFLQHGVIGLKSQLSNGVSLAAYLQSLAPTFDLMVVSTDAEKSLVQGLGVDANKLALTGLPRFDLYTNSVAENKSVLVFFTWQNPAELASKQAELLGSPAFKALADSGYQIKFGEHSMQADMAGESALSGADLQVAVITSSLLITDDSSMAWDFFYQNKEVIFYRRSTNWLSQDAGLLARSSGNLPELELQVQQFLNGRDPLEINFVGHGSATHCQRVVEAANGQIK